MSELRLGVGWQNTDALSSVTELCTIWTGQRAAVLSGRARATAVSSFSSAFPLGNGRGCRRELLYRMKAVVPDGHAILLH